MDEDSDDILLADLVRGGKSLVVGLDWHPKFC